MPERPARTLRHAATFVLILLAVEFLDELVYGATEAVLPAIRDALALSYLQVKLLQGVPGMVSSVVEPFLGILGDVWRRRLLVLGGGVVFALALLLTGLSRTFGLLLASFVLFYPSSGAFVSLSQATLMDLDPARHEHNMARWVLAGAVGVLAGSMLAGGAALLELGWRPLFFAFAGLTVILVVAVGRLSIPWGRAGAAGVFRLKEGLLEALRALRRREVLRWLTLLQFSDLMLDVLLGFVALYFVDVAGATPAQGAMAVAVWTGTALLGDLLLIPLLERVAGLRYLRLSAVIELLLFTALMLVRPFWAKYVLLGLLGLFSAGWYSILQARLYTAMPGQSGTVMTVNNIYGLVGSLIPLGLGLAADAWGLQAAMWLLLAGPLALLVGLPRGKAQCGGG